MFIEPSEIIKSFGIKHGETVADFGCGTGHYSVEAGKLVGKSGVVYAIDVQKDLLASVKSRAESEGLENINTVWADLDKLGGSKLADGVVDLVLISNILFQAEKKEVMISEAFRVLKSGGRVIVIEWKKQAEKIGPPIMQRLAMADTERLIIQGGFKFRERLEIGPSHYGLIFYK